MSHGADCRRAQYTVDVWDGPDEPLIYHGRTLTSKLPARDALLAIAKYAFVASPYPVILSMEVHCDQEQQDKLAEILRSSLGTALIDAPLFGEETVEAHAGCPRVDALPSPEELKYRILVKAKNLYVVQAAQKIEEPELESESSSSSSSQSSDSDLKRGARVSRPIRVTALQLTFPRCECKQSFRRLSARSGRAHPPISHLHLRQTHMQQSQTPSAGARRPI